MNVFLYFTSYLHYPHCRWKTVKKIIKDSINEIWANKVIGYHMLHEKQFLFLLLNSLVGFSPILLFLKRKLYCNNLKDRSKILHHTTFHERLECTSTNFITKQDWRIEGNRWIMKSSSLWKTSAKWNQDLFGLHWSPNPQCADIWKWGFWEVVRFRRSHEGGAPMCD